MKRRTIWLAMLALAIPTLAAAQDICATTSGTVLQLNPSKLYANLPEQTVNELDGSPRVTDYQLAYFSQGANPATATPSVGPITMAKTAWTLVAGSVDCYQATMPAAVPVTATPLIGVLKARRAASATVGAAESNWSVVSNPFGSAPTALAAPGLKVAR